MRYFSPKRDGKLVRTESPEQRKCAKAAEQTNEPPPGARAAYEPLRAHSLPDSSTLTFSRLRRQTRAVHIILRTL